MRVDLVPLGPVPPDLLIGLSDALAGYGLVGEVRQEMPIPDGAYMRERDQWDADLLLQELEGGTSPVLGITAKDLYSSGLNFVFGLATLGASRALVSFARLGSKDATQVRDRLVKESVHELGHGFGLGHCANARCVMRFSDSLDDADAKGSDFCAKCLDRLPRALGPRR